MSQQIFFTAATASTENFKRALGALFAPQLLYGAELSIAPGSVLQIAPHGCCFEGGAILTESEQRTLDIPLGAAARNWTIRYRYSDTNMFRISSADLALEEGLLASGGERAVLGWIRYPGGSVAASASMLRAAPRGQSVDGGRTERQQAQNWLRILSSAVSPTVGPEPFTLSVPATPGPYTVTLAAGDTLLSSAAGTGLVLKKADGTVLTQRSSLGDLVAASPEFYLDYTTRIATFTAVLASTTVYATDLTRGTGGWIFNNTSGSTALDEFAASFCCGSRPPSRVLIETLRTAGALDATVTPLFLIDCDGVRQTLGRTETVLDGIQSLTTAEVAAGTFRADQQWTIVFRTQIATAAQFCLRTIEALTE